MADRQRTASSARPTADTPRLGRRVDPRRRARLGGRARLRAAVVGLAAAASLALAGCSTSLDAGPEPGPGAASGTPSPTVTAAPTTTVAVDPAAFTAIDRPTWDAIAHDPEAAKGQRVVVYGTVERVFTSAGPGVLQARVTTTQPADPAEGTGAVVRVDAAAAADVQPGDVLELRATVAGAFGGATGATNRAPELTAVAVDEVGLRDLRADVVIGTPTTDTAGVSLPVVITNSGDVPMDYKAAVMAAGADGTTSFGTITAHASTVAPGQAGQAKARFGGALPSGVTFTLVSVTRTPTPPAPTQ